MAAPARPQCAADALGAAASDGGPHPHAALWELPAGVRPPLRVLNSLTRTKTLFATHTPGVVRWYNCGPTVYDAAHIGHARNYVTFDAIRRILEGHFGYAVHLVMNVTDIDDKIILRARQGHLCAQYAALHQTRSADLEADLARRLDDTVNSRLGRPGKTASDWDALHNEITSAPNDGDAAAKRALAYASLRSAWDALCNPNLDAPSLIAAFRDVLGPSLDAEAGASVTAHAVFGDLARTWEAAFLEDMAALGVRPPTVLTRVSEFVPEVVGCVSRILDAGLAYEADGSVYFSVTAFLSSGGDARVYARLCPWSAGDASFCEEGEGALGARLGGKRDPRDFCLWKASKAGEPSWPSPWGPGRPGWHIECTAMAAAVAPGPLDVHSGGIDLAFPHHDNEIAQAEAADSSLPPGQWVAYFLHAGHVHVDGLKMSKSLKNFVSIRDALAQTSPRVLRLFFLSHAWAAPLTYSADALGPAAALDASLVQFLATADALLRRADALSGPCPAWASAEAALFAALSAAARAVDAAFADSFDTPGALGALSALVAAGNAYLRDARAAGTQPHMYLVRSAAEYLRRTLGTMGLEYAPVESNSADDRLLPVLGHVSALRDTLRAAVRDGTLDAQSAMRACDDLRAALADMGVLLEDQPAGAASLVKLLAPADAARMRADAAAAAEARAARRLAALRLEEERIARAALPPAALLAGFGAYDGDGFPTHDAAGEPLSKAARKRVLRQFEEQRVRHEAFLRDTLGGAQ